MSKFGTGHTITDIILSVNNDNNPVPSATFTIDVFRDGMTETGVTVSTMLVDATSGVFSSTWSASTEGDYQVLYKNDITNVLFVTDTYNIVPDSDLSTSVYVGL